MKIGIDIQEEVAKIIYYHYNGISSPDEYFEFWQVNQPTWDELAEWQRDDCRFQSEKILKFLKGVKYE